MFDRTRHRINRRLCLPYAQWDGLLLRCSKCGGIMADSYGEPQVWPQYAHFDDPIISYINQVPPEKQCDNIGEILDGLKDSVVKYKESLVTEARSEVEDLGSLWLSLDVEYDNEDSAAGDLNLSGYGISEEKMEEQVE